MRLVLISLILMAGTAYAEIDLSAIARIESGGCKAPCIGDNGLALGPYQLHAGAVKDASRYLKAQYLHQDALEPKKAVILANAYVNGVLPLYLIRMGLPDNLENRLTAYNMGIGAVKKGRVAHEYIRKYRLYASSSASDEGLGNG